MLKDKYIEYLTYEKRFSPHTIIAYQADLTEFSQYLSGQYNLPDPALADYQMVRSWLISLYQDNISPRSVKRKLSTLKSFYRFCLKQKAITVDPMLKVTSPKFSNPLPVFLTRDNLSQLFTPGSFDTDYEGQRDKMILMLFYATGMRAAELAGLSLHDIDPGKSTVKVLGKRSKERLIPLGNYVIGELMKYQSLRAAYIAENMPGSENNIHWLFVTSKGAKLYPKLVYNIVHSNLQRVASNHKLSPHVLRHTFATHMLDSGADLNAIKELLGHSNLAATQVYTHNTVEKLKSIYQQAHPRA